MLHSSRAAEAGALTVIVPWGVVVAREGLSAQRAAWHGCSPYSHAGHGRGGGAVHMSSTPRVESAWFQLLDSALLSKPLASNLTPEHAQPLQRGWA